MLKKIAAVSFIVSFAFSFAALAYAPSKVTICHATSSTTTPYVKTVVSPNAISGHFDNHGTPIAGHEGDILYEGDVDCPAGTGGGGDTGGGGSTGGGGCTVPIKPTGFDVGNATMNDNTLELSWDIIPDTDFVVIRWGYEEDEWDFDATTDNDGFEPISGLTNGIHYWFQVVGVNDCGEGVVSENIDPLP